MGIFSSFPGIIVKIPGAVPSIRSGGLVRAYLNPSFLGMRPFLTRRSREEKLNFRPTKEERGKYVLANSDVEMSLPNWETARARNFAPRDAAHVREEAN